MPEGYKISLRCQSKTVNVSALAKKCSKGIGSGGGHEQAAGALVSDFDKFRKRAIREIKKQIKK